MKHTSTAGRLLRFANVPGERMLPNAKHKSSRITKVAFGETDGVPSSFMAATIPALWSLISFIIS
jgi:hypothetical protein